MQCLKDAHSIEIFNTRKPSLFFSSFLHVRFQSANTETPRSQACEAFLMICVLFLNILSCLIEITAYILRLFFFFHLAIFWRLFHRVSYLLMVPSWVAMAIAYFLSLLT